MSRQGSIFPSLREVRHYPSPYQARRILVTDLSLAVKDICTWSWGYYLFNIEEPTDTFFVVDPTEDSDSEVPTKVHVLRLSAKNCLTAALPWRGCGQKQSEHDKRVTISGDQIWSPLGGHSDHLSVDAVPSRAPRLPR
jgi:hypothetical protein